AIHVAPAGLAARVLAAVVSFASRVVRRLVAAGRRGVVGRLGLVAADRAEARGKQQRHNDREARGSHVHERCYHEIAATCYRSQVPNSQSPSGIAKLKLARRIWAGSWWRP